MQLHNRVVIITGAKGGLGSFVTNAFLNEGAQVVGVSRSISAADFPREGFTAMPAELTDAEGARKLAAAVVEKKGRIDALVHLVGGYTGGHTIGDTDDGTFDHMISLNLRSAFDIIRAVLPYMRDQSRSQGAGRILAVGSRAAVEPAAMAGVYAASKAALVSLIRTVASENADHRISANIVLPGTMDTPANRTAMPNADFSHWVQPCQVASMLVYLASDAGAQITGAAIPIYGLEV